MEKPGESLQQEMAPVGRIHFNEPASLKKRYEAALVAL
jgi:hypothetical protein